MSVGNRHPLQETWVLPTYKYVGENAKNVGKGYPDVQNDVGKNVGGNASREAFPTPIWYGVGKGFPDAVRCVGIDGVGKTLFPTPSMSTHRTASGKPIFRLTRRREIPQNASGKGEFPTLIKPLFPTFHAASGKTPIPDAAPDALCTASGKAPFPDVLLPTPSWCVGKDCFPDASPDALLMASGKPLFPTFFMPT
ncbi:hypothetical protein E6C27_scaffold98G00050 [Cucumis melo var. makuwa]|uniref:Uncharacterized protein n=1 Tax=Cucumis melo var. makuwa TaxID=1194695 RepID=A0A5A7UVY5_CUCMM|nr:hypothetical protein E6C27_scaffold98G00050 [Cucumis melo var. makuwa]